MSVLVYIDSEKGKIKQNAFEVVSYAKAIAQRESKSLIAVLFNSDEGKILGEYGVDKICLIRDEKLSDFTAKAYAEVLQQVANQENCKTVITSSSTNARYLAAILAVKLNAAYVPNVISLPEGEKFTVKHHVFSNKAYSYTDMLSDCKIISLAGNVYSVDKIEGKGIVEDFTPSFSEKAFDVKIENVNKVTGKVSIADADIIVSGGRGLKGSENWGMLEELADVLGAATACSKPVSDMGWRPHSEHVGQTGKPVSSNLYIAIGISGAIQHLAGVSAAKVKVVINSDENAPFFKAADYGVVGDAFEIVPKLTEKLKKFKSENS